MEPVTKYPLNPPPEHTTRIYFQYMHIKIEPKLKKTTMNLPETTRSISAAGA